MRGSEIRSNVLKEIPLGMTAGIAPAVIDRILSVAPTGIVPETY